MAADAFNTLGGYSVGIPAIPVVDSTGRVVANVSATYVRANTVLTDNLRFSNGQPFIGGSNNQIQFNSNSSLDGNENLTFDSTSNLLAATNLAVSGSVTLGDVTNLSIQGGLNGYFLQTDGLGQLSWAAAGGSGGNGTPGGSNTNIQFNDSGDFGGVLGFTFNKLTTTLNVANIHSDLVTANLSGTASYANVANTVTVNAQPNITSVGTLTTLHVANTVTANLFSGSGANLINIPAANLIGSVPLANAVTDNAQPNITSVGTLTTLHVTGDITSSGAISTSGNVLSGNVNASNRISASNVFVTNNITVGNTVIVTQPATLALVGNLDATRSFNVNLGSISNIHISGGFNGQVLSTDGTGNLTWTTGGGGGGGNGTPGGANGQVQFNSAGDFGGSPYLTFNNDTHSLNISGNLIANTIQMGSGVYKFCTSTVYFATTSSSSPNQVLWTIPSALISAVDFTIVSTDTTGGTRQTSKISATVLGDVVAYNEYAGLHINGGVGSFSVGFNPGNIMIPPSVQLLVSPDSTNLTQYNMMIVEYAA